MGLLKRKIHSTDETPASKPKGRSLDDRPRKKPKQEKDSKNGKVHISSKAENPTETSKKVSLLREEEPAFPRGGASVLTPLEHKQIKIEATRDVLFEQSNSKRTSAPNESDQEQDASLKTAPKRGKKTKTVEKKGRAGIEAEQASGIKIEGLSYNVGGLLSPTASLRH